jgi:hypothetical protein
MMIGIDPVSDFFNSLIVLGVGDPLAIAFGDCFVFRF